MYSFRESLGPVTVAFTDRRGGVSSAPFDALNLALEGDDDADAIAENWRLVLDDLAPGARLADLRQVHGGTVVAADVGDRPEADAIVTTDRDVVLAVRAADCVPVLLADPDAGVVGAAHCGRLGLLAEVVPHAVEALRARGAAAITAWVGPHVCGGCYEVPDDMRAEVAAVVPESRATTTWGTPALDLGAGVTAQLRAAGVDVVDASVGFYLRLQK